MHGVKICEIAYEIEGVNPCIQNVPFQLRVTTLKLGSFKKAVQCFEEIQTISNKLFLV